MLVAGMLLAVLVLGPLVILGVMAVASNERAITWLRQVIRRARGGEGTVRPVADNAPDVVADTAPDASPGKATSAASGPTQQSA